MPNIITSSTDQTWPDNVDGYEASRSGGTLVHPILGNTNPDVTLRPASLRSGTLKLSYIYEGDAIWAFNLLSTPDMFTFTSDDRFIVGMNFVIPEGEQITLSLDDATRDLWHLEVPYQEVSAL